MFHDSQGRNWVFLRVSAYSSIIATEHERRTTSETKWDEAIVSDLGAFGDDVLQKPIAESRTVSPKRERTPLRHVKNI